MTFNATNVTNKRVAVVAAGVISPLGIGLDATLQSLRTAVDCAPDLVEPHYHLGEALAKAGQTGKSRDQFERVVQLAKPDDPLRKKAEERLAGLPGRK